MHVGSHATETSEGSKSKTEEVFFPSRNASIEVCSMTVACYGNKGMRRDANKIQVNGQMTNGQIARRIGWQDERGQMNSARCKATKLLHDSDTRMASK